eukprot:TRINITY_DN7421_c0_g1_i1.p1 TRINITY_DN7421_c0_g1~~TRINITY_DN7421_c0_g1_i1.p1  ORF type:complete len:149 (-),score=10.06 TRINITY_DN7421_c0_g1_i1:223-669(-)
MMALRRSCSFIFDHRGQNWRWKGRGHDLFRGQLFYGEGPSSPRRFYNINAQERICSMLNRSKIVIFIRGTERKPACPYSKEVVTILKENGYKFESIDVNKDYNAEAGIQEYSNLEGIPQIYYKSDLVGTYETFIQIHKEGKLKETLSS